VEPVPVIATEVPTGDAAGITLKLTALAWAARGVV
jgi:hypothetical protein